MLRGIAVLAPPALPSFSHCLFSLPLLLTVLTHAHAHAYIARSTVRLLSDYYTIVEVDDFLDDENIDRLAAKCHAGSRSHAAIMRDISAIVRASWERRGCWLV